MRLPRLRFTVWRMMVAVAIIAVTSWALGYASSNDYYNNTTTFSIQGKVARVDWQNKRVILDIGSDDGLSSGQVLFLYRSKPLPKYLGKVRIISVDPHRAVTEVVGSGAIRDIEIQEGDHASGFVRQEGDATEKRIIDEVKVYGSVNGIRVERDKGVPGRPVVRVDLSYIAATDVLLEHLKGLKNSGCWTSAVPRSQTRGWST